jgi:uncharacterized Zn-binding protein involved in type VI secretion
MGQPAAKKGDRIEGKDLHLVKFPNGVVQLVPLDFKGTIDDTVSPNVKIMGAPAATVGSLGTNRPEHKLALAPPQDFVIKPNNQGRITNGSGTVRINGKAAARDGDVADTCHDAPGAPPKVVATGSVLIG